MNKTYNIIISILDILVIVLACLAIFNVWDKTIVIFLAMLFMSVIFLLKGIGFKDNSKKARTYYVTSVIVVIVGILTLFI